MSKPVSGTPSGIQDSTYQQNRGKQFYQLIEENEKMKEAIAEVESLISYLEFHSTEGKAAKDLP
jgi:hypothetical protein